MLLSTELSEFNLINPIDEGELVLVSSSWFVLRLVKM